MRISDWSSDVCSSDLAAVADLLAPHRQGDGDPLDLQDLRGVERRVGIGRRPGDPADGQPAGTVEAVMPADGGDHCLQQLADRQIVTASCRDRVCSYVWISVVAFSYKKKNDTLC